jgi:hypothetical protein
MSEDVPPCRTTPHTYNCMARSVGKGNITFTMEVSIEANLYDMKVGKMWWQDCSNQDTLGGSWGAYSATTTNILWGTRLQECYWSQWIAVGLLISNPPPLKTRMSVLFFLQWCFIQAYASIWPIPHSRSPNKYIKHQFNVTFSLLLLFEKTKLCLWDHPDVYVCLIIFWMPEQIFTKRKFH